MTHPIALTAFATLLAVLGFVAFGYVWPKISLFYPGYRVERFRSLSGAFPARRIESSPAPVSFQVNLTPISQSYRFKGQERLVEEFLTRSETTAFLIVHRGTIVHEAYFQGNTDTDLVTSFSVAKSFVSTLVGIAFEDGLIDQLDDPITKYVPELKETGFDGVAISDVLTMSSGIDFSEDYEDKSTDAFSIYNKLFLYFRSVKRVMLDYGSQGHVEPAFQYASINTQALGQLIENVTGMSVAEYLAQEIWHPLGATSSASWATDIYGNVLSFWGLNATAIDFARLGVLFADGGRYQDKQVISPDWLARATSPQEDRLKRGEIEGFWGYGYQWWLPEGSRGDFSAIGIWGQFIYVDPGTNTVIVKTSADPNFKEHEPEAIAVFRAIADGLDRAD